MAESIVTLAPGADEWIAAMGGTAQRLTGPSELRHLEHEPDLIVVRTEDEASVRKIIGDRGQDVEVFVFDPQTFKQSLDAALSLARRIGRLPSAMQIIGEGETRLRRLRDAIGIPRGEGPSTSVLTSLDGLSSHAWIPSLVEQAGGRIEADLDEATCVIIALSEGGVDEACDRIAGVEHLDPARCQLSVIDGSRYVTRPGPSLYRAVELMAVAIHGERSGVEARPDELRRVSAEVHAS